MNLDELLLTVQKPGRYIGREWNAVVKDWTPDKVKVLLAFPDVYEVGMSYLGIKILYGILNGRSDCLCERVFSPWVDFEDVLRKNNMELFSLESRRPIKEFDIIGFSLAYELNYTNLLNMLDLGGIPKRSSERTAQDPLIIAGGPACYNPEPMAEFIDAFIIGDGEEAIVEIVEAYKNSKLPTPNSKLKLLRELAKIEGVYVPSLYKVNYTSDGTISAFSPIEEGVPLRVKKRIVKNLNSSFYPTDQIVPYIEIVHDRITLEIMRGCKHMCRFCQSGTTYRPWRERSKEKILELAKESYKRTGYEEISLLSLSSGDHSQIKEITRDLNKFFTDKGVSLSVPSLRIEDALRELPALISEVKKPGLTFAPEAGSVCLRRHINKNINIEELFKTVSTAFAAGWKRVKLYFMIGLPREKEEDIFSIAELIYKIANLKREIDGKPASITASINAFVPKPHTPFQWKAMENPEILNKKKEMLKHRIKSGIIKLDFHSFNMSYMEAVVARGDRRLSDVIYGAWKAGARFDGWQDFFNPGLWMGSFKNSGIDPDFYALKTKRFDEILPWDFIDIGLNKEWLSNEAESSI